MTVNGKEKELQEEMNLKEFLEKEGYHTGRVAVEYNGQIIRKAQLEDVIVKDEDKLEIVKFVGGGCM